MIVNPDELRPEAARASRFRISARGMVDRDGAGLRAALPPTCDRGWLIVRGTADDPVDLLGRECNPLSQRRPL